MAAAQQKASGYAKEAAATAPNKEAAAPEQAAALKNFEEANRMVPGSANVNQVERNGGINVWSAPMQKQEQLLLAMNEEICNGALCCVRELGQQFDEFYHELQEIAAECKELNEGVCKFAKKFQPMSMAAYAAVTKTRDYAKDFLSEQLKTIEDCIEAEDWFYLAEITEDMAGTMKPAIKEFDEMVVRYTELTTEGVSLQADAAKAERDAKAAGGKAEALGGTGAAGMAAYAVAGHSAFVVVGGPVTWTAFAAIYGSCAVAGTGLLIVGDKSAKFSKLLEKRIHHVGDLIGQMQVLLEVHQKQTIRMQALATGVLGDHAKIAQNAEKNALKTPDEAKNPQREKLRAARMTRIVKLMEGRLVDLVTQCDEYMRIDDAAHREAAEKVGVTWLKPATPQTTSSIKDRT